MGFNSGLKVLITMFKTYIFVSNIHVIKKNKANLPTFILSLFVNGGTLLVAQLVEVLQYKPEDRGFDSR
jgi:hypothetical protein